MSTMCMCVTMGGHGEYSRKLSREGCYFDHLFEKYSDIPHERLEKHYCRLRPLSNKDDISKNIRIVKIGKYSSKRKKGGQDRSNERTLMTPMVHLDHDACWGEIPAEHCHEIFMRSAMTFTHERVASRGTPHRTT